MYKKKEIYAIFIILFVYFCYAEISKASDSVDLFKEGNALYEKGNFKEAIASYEKILKDVVDARLYYNLGNAYFKAGFIGKAILYYEKALILSPRDRDVKQNLKYVRSLTFDKQFEEQDGIIHFFLSGLNGFLSINELTVAVLIFYLLLFFLGITYIFTDSVMFKFYLRIIAGFLLVFFLLFTFFLSVRIYAQEYNSRAIIMTAQEKARSGPGENYTEVFSVHEGSWVFLRQNQEDWSQITLPSGYTGWIKNRALEKI